MTIFRRAASRAARFGLALSALCNAAAASPLKSDEEVILFPTAAHLGADGNYAQQRPEVYGPGAHQFQEHMRDNLVYCSWRERRSSLPR